MRSTNRRVWEGFFMLVGLGMLAVVSAHYLGWPGPVGVFGVYLIWRVNS